MITHTIDQFILNPNSKQDKANVTNLKNLPKLQNFLILKKKNTLHATHLLKLLDKMCKYEMNPASIVEDVEQTRFCPQMDRRTRWNQYTPLQLSWARGGGGGGGGGREYNQDPTDAMVTMGWIPVPPWHVHGSVISCLLRPGNP